MKTKTFSYEWQDDVLLNEWTPSSSITPEEGALQAIQTHYQNQARPLALLYEGAGGYMGKGCRLGHSRRNIGQ